MAFSRYYKTLTQVEPFAQLRSESQKQFCSDPRIQWQAIEKGNILHLQNEVCQRIDVIIEGQFAVQNIDADGNMMTIQIFSDRELLGTNLLFSSRNHYPMTIIATQKSVIAQVPKQLLLEMCRQNEVFTVALLQCVSDRSILLTDKIQSIALKSIRKAILEFLKFESTIQNNQQVLLPISKKALAERLGVERTSLSRELDKMRKDGLICFDAQSITLLK